MQCKLRPLEAICVAGVVEDCLDRLRVLESLTPNVLTQRDELSTILGDTVAQIIQEQKRAEEKYENLVKRRSELKSLSNKSRYKKNQEKIEAQARELQELTRELCKRLRESPNVSENLMKIQTERSKLAELFLEFKEELIKDYSFKKIAESTSSSTLKYQQMMQVMQHDKETQKQIKDLDAKIRKMESDMAHRLEELEASIKEQKEQLQQIQSSNEGEKAKKDDEREARKAAIEKIKKLSGDQLNIQLQQAHKQLEKEKQVHELTLKYFQKRSHKIAQMTEEWKAKADSETTTERTRLEGFQKRIESAASDFAELKPEKEEADRLMKQEMERASRRAMQAETRAQQTDFMNKLKILFMLHARIRGPLPKPKSKGRRR